MRGCLKLDGANILAWIDGVDLPDAIEGEWKFRAQDRQRVVFEVEVAGYGTVYPNLMEGHLAIRYPIHWVPSFGWAKEAVNEVIITLHQGYAPYPFSFTIPVSELPEKVVNFRVWARAKLLELTQEPTNENGLLPWLELAEAKGWRYTYEPKQTDKEAVAITGQIARTKAGKASMYILELRAKEHQMGRIDAGERAVLAPNWGSFLSSVEALIGSDDGLPDLTKGEHSGAAAA